MAVPVYSNELKDQVIKEVQETGSVQLVAKKHGLIPRTVNNWMRGFRDKDKISEQKKYREMAKEIHDLRIHNELLKEIIKKTAQASMYDDRRS
jgi:transposase-like protein